MKANCLSLVIIAVAVAISAQPASEISKFELVIASNATLTSGGISQHLETKTTWQYSLEKSGNKVVLSVDAIAVFAAVDGKVRMHLLANKDKMRILENGRWAEVSPANAPWQLREQMACYSQPICEIVLDSSGKEVERKPIPVSGAQQLFDNGIIATLRLFHVAFVEDSPKWEVPREISLGYGGYANGNLTYERTTGPEDLPEEHVCVSVSGKLTGNLETEVAAIKDSVFELQGEQIYDTSAGEWHSGRIEIGWKADYQAAEERGSVVGKMEIVLTDVTAREKRIENLRRAVEKALHNPIPLPRPLIQEQRDR